MVILIEIGREGITQRQHREWTLVLLTSTTDSGDIACRVHFHLTCETCCLTQELLGLLYAFGYLFDERIITSTL